MHPLLMRLIQKGTVLMKPWYVTLVLQFSQNTITLLIIYHEQSQFLPVDVLIKKYYSTYPILVVFEDKQVTVLILLNAQAQSSL